MPTGKIYLGSTLISDPGAGGGPTLWTPGSITTELWLDANDASTVTSAVDNGVTQWNDKSGNGRNFTAPAGATAPGLTSLGGKYVLDFNRDFLTSASTAATWNFLHDTTGSSIFLVVKAGASSNPNDLYTVLGNNVFDPANRGIVLYYDDRSASSINNQFVMYVTNGSGGYASSVDPQNVWTPNAFQVIGFLSDPGNATVGSRGSLRFNGGAAVETNSQTAAVSASNANFTLQIGAGGNSSTVFRFVGAIAEIVIVSGLISDANRERMEGYLAHKWGLEANLPSGHPYKSAAPTV